MTRSVGGGRFHAERGNEGRTRGGYFERSAPPKLSGRSLSSVVVRTLVGSSALTRMTSIVEPNSLRTWRQAPHGEAPPLVTTATATIRLWPAATAEQTAPRSAQMVRP